jgi:hypothetical protein
VFPDRGRTRKLRSGPRDESAVGAPTTMGVQNCTIFCLVTPSGLLGSDYTASHTRDKYPSLCSVVSFSRCFEILLSFLYVSLFNSSLAFYLFVYSSLSFSLLLLLPFLTLRIFLSIYLSIYLSAYPLTYLPIYLSIYLTIYLSIYLSIYLFICLSVCLSICRASFKVYRKEDDLTCVMMEAKGL